MYMNEMGTSRGQVRPSGLIFTSCAKVTTYTVRLTPFVGDRLIALSKRLERQESDFLGLSSAN
jgi:hypothetical protein